MKKTVFLIVIFAVLFFCTALSTAMDYYVSTSGNDTNSGISQNMPWKTVAKINSFNLQPGDMVHFRCGDEWREQLIPSNGSQAGNITYTSYGTGNKPLFIGSVNKSSTLDWKQVGSNLWQFNASTSNSIESSKTFLPSDLKIWTAETAKVTSSVSDGSYQISCSSAGNTTGDIQLMLRGLQVESGKTYKLTFNAKCTSPFALSSIYLMKSISPWTNYSPSINTVKNISTSFNTYEVLYTSSATDQDARITFYLGKYLPAGSILTLSSIKIESSQSSKLLIDVGNIILNDGAEFGKKVFTQSDLIKQNDFFYDKTTNNLYIYSAKNPAELYSKVECALTRNIVDENGKYYVAYNNLAFKNGSAHGIGGADTHHITISNCDISFIGGGEMSLGGQSVRYGNGIEFWGNAHDNTVQNCRIWEVYDAAVTNQAVADSVNQYNISYTGNTIWNCEYSYEYWQKGNMSTTSGIHFEKNTCKNAGSGWGHSQRPDPKGEHLMFYSNNAVTKDFYIRNNVFSQADQACAFIDANWNGFENLVMGSNQYVQSKGIPVVIVGSKEYHVDDFALYRSDTGKDAGSTMSLAQ
ncbi:MAG TPA: carbohydrate binding domain-containing protein [Clostridia bacterium]